MKVRQLNVITLIFLSATVAVTSVFGAERNLRCSDPTNPEIEFRVKLNTSETKWESHITSPVQLQKFIRDELKFDLTLGASKSYPIKLSESSVSFNGNYEGPFGSQLHHSVSVKLGSELQLVVHLTPSLLGGFVCQEILSPVSSEVTSEIIQDIEELRPYYFAISRMRAILEEAASKLEYRTGFSAWPIPHPRISRTFKYIFLETVRHSDGSEIIEELYTPFGKVSLLSGGFGLDMDVISKAFLSAKNLELIDVTKSIRVYEYDQETGKKAEGSFNDSSDFYGNSRKVYLVKKIDSIDFSKGGLDTELGFFESVETTERQYCRDRAQFICLSEGRDCF